MKLEPNRTKEAVLCFLLRDRAGTRETCLALKKKSIGAGKWNGYGGEVEAGESKIQAVMRETREETKAQTGRKSGVMIDPTDLDWVARATFHNALGDSRWSTLVVHVFLAKGFLGEPQESSEMGPPVWMDIDSLPVRGMMLADPYWWPWALHGEKIIVEAKYAQNQESLFGPVIVKPAQGPFEHLCI